MDLSKVPHSRDYWAEYSSAKEHLQRLSCGDHHSDIEFKSLEDDSDAFLECIIPGALKHDRELSESEVVNYQIYHTLTERQKAQLLRRAQRRNQSMRLKRLKMKNQKPHLRQIFSSTENFNTEIGSRSATPDSLDSISPPHTPPDNIHHKSSWVDPTLSQSRASIDSGHHSLVVTPSCPLSSYDRYPITPESRYKKYAGGLNSSSCTSLVFDTNGHNSSIDEGGSNNEFGNNRTNTLDNRINELETHVDTLDNRRNDLETHVDTLKNRKNIVNNNQTNTLDNRKIIINNRTSSYENHSDKNYTNNNNTQLENQKNNSNNLTNTITKNAQLDTLKKNTTPNPKTVRSQSDDKAIVNILNSNTSTLKKNTLSKNKSTQTQNSKPCCDRRDPTHYRLSLSDDEEYSECRCVHRTLSQDSYTSTLKRGLGCEIEMSPYSKTLERNHRGEIIVDQRALRTLERVPRRVYDASNLRPLEITQKGLSENLSSVKHLECPSKARSPDMPNLRQLGRPYIVFSDMSNPRTLERNPRSELKKDQDISDSKTLERPPREGLKGEPVSRQRSYAKDISKDLRFPYRQKGNYDLNLRPQFQYHEVEPLRYNQIGSMHIRNKEKVSIFDDDFVQDFKNEKWHDNPTALGQNLRLFEHADKPQFYTRKDEKFQHGVDLGFKVLSDHEKFPTILLEVGRVGRTNVDWLHPSDQSKLRALSLLELDILFTEKNIHHRWRKIKKNKKIKDIERHGVFGVPLEALSEKDKKFCDQNFYTEKLTPSILSKLCSQLELRGIKDEGILRIPGNRSKIDALKATINNNFYSNRQSVESDLRTTSPNDIAALIKLFLRDLPDPILTNHLTLAFFKTHAIQNVGERVLALSMLVNILPEIHRHTLQTILSLCVSIISYEGLNKMGLYNVAMIVAPNIFLPSFEPKFNSNDKKKQINAQMEYTRTSTDLVQCLIKYHEVIWSVPCRLIAQLRHQSSPSSSKLNNEALHKKLVRKHGLKESIKRPIQNEVDYQNGIMRVTAFQFEKVNHPVKLDCNIRAKDILRRFIEEYTASSERPNRAIGRREQKISAQNFVSAPFPAENVITSSTFAAHAYSYPRMTTCLLRGSIKHALKNHALHERGGNICEKRIDNEAYLIAVYQNNPNAEFYVKCHHPGGQSDQ